MAIKSLIKDGSGLNNLCYVIVELVTALQVGMRGDGEGLLDNCRNL